MCDRRQKGEEQGKKRVSMVQHGSVYDRQRRRENKVIGAVYDNDGKTDELK